MRVLVFGDSITQGYWDRKGGWVNRLREHYDSLQISSSALYSEPSIFNLGVSADSSKDILQRIENEVEARIISDKLPVVMVQIGINDSLLADYSQTESKVVPEDYASNLQEIIKKISPISSKIIFVGSSACDESRTTPVFWNNNHFKNELIKKYEDIMKEVAHENNIPFISIFNVFKKHLDSGENLLRDGLHPNETGHELLKCIVLDKLDSIL